MLRCCGLTKERKKCINRIKTGYKLCYQHSCQDDSEFEPRVEEPRCSGTTRKGSQCKFSPSPSVKSGCTLEYCYLHQPIPDDNFTVIVLNTWNSIGVFNDSSLLQKAERSYEWNKGRTTAILPEKRAWHLKDAVSFPPHKVKDLYSQYRLTEKSRPGFVIADLINLINDFVGLDYIFLSQNSVWKFVPSASDDMEGNSVLCRLNCVYIKKNDCIILEWTIK